MCQFIYSEHYNMNNNKKRRLNLLIKVSIKKHTIQLIFNIKKKFKKYYL